MYRWYARKVGKGRVLLCKGLSGEHNTSQESKNEPQEGRNSVNKKVAVAQPLCDI